MCLAPMASLASLSGAAAVLCSLHVLHPRRLQCSLLGCSAVVVLTVMLQSLQEHLLPLLQLLLALPALLPQADHSQRCAARLRLVPKAEMQLCGATCLAGGTLYIQKEAKQLLWLLGAACRMPGMCVLSIHLGATNHQMPTTDSKAQTMHAINHYTIFRGLQ